MSEIKKLFFFLSLILLFLLLFLNKSFSFINNPNFSINYFNNNFNVTNLHQNAEFGNIDSLDFFQYLISDDSTNKKNNNKNPNESRMFVMPTAKPVKSGKGYWALNEFVFPTVSFGIENLLSLTAGISIMFGSENQLIHLAPKLTVYNTNQISLATGLFYVKPLSGKRNSIGIIYGIGTYDHEFFSITAGGGYGFEEDRFSKTGLVILGGEIKVTDGFSILSENWFPFKTDEIINSIGIRIYGSVLAFDLGFIIPKIKDKVGFSRIPWLALVYNF